MMRSLTEFPLFAKAGGDCGINGWVFIERFEGFPHFMVIPWNCGIGQAKLMHATRIPTVANERDVDCRHRLGSWNGRNHKQCG